MLFVHAWSVSSSLAAAQCQSHAELPRWMRGEPWTSAASSPGTAAVKLTSVPLWFE